MAAKPTGKTEVFRGRGSVAKFRVFGVFAAAGAPLRGYGLSALATSALPRLVVKNLRVLCVSLTNH